MSMAVGQPARRQAERAFFTGMALAAALTMFAGFAPTYFLRSSALTPLTPLYHFHGAVFTTWFVLFIVQSSLVAGGRADIHRRVGLFGAILAALMVVLGVIVSIDTLRANVDAGGPVDARMLLSIPLGSIVVFAMLVTAAVALRHRTDFHKRLMLLASVSMLSAAIGRIFPQVGIAIGPVALVGLFVATDLFVAALAVYDYVSRGRVHAATLWGGALVIAFKPLLLALSSTPPWLAFADALR